MAVRVACCQLAPDVEDPEGSAERARSAIAEAVAAGAQVIVLPELANSGYVFGSSGEARAAAVSAGGELLDGWARALDGSDAVVVGGFCELADDGRVFNSAALVEASGVRAVYRKLHLWGEEPRWFQRGEEPAPVVETRHGRIGLGVCYDIEFPELARGLALDGAELIALPTNWPREADGARPGGLSILTVLASAGAYHSKVFVAVCDRCGSERGLEFEGGSVIADRGGMLLAGPPGGGRAEMIEAVCDLERARDKRSGPHNNAFADRRLEHYRGVGR
jgi:5-aminopentanamidase